MTVKLASLLRRTLLRVLPQRAQHALILKMLNGNAPDDIEVTVADTPHLLQRAAELTFEAYHAKRLVDLQGVPLRVTPYLMLPSTIVFIAKRRGEVVGTMALIRDSELGLPMEGTFTQEVTALRAQGRRIAEVGALAVKRGERAQGLAMLIYKAMWLTAAQLLDVQDLVIAVHPDAEQMYRAPLLFERMANEVRSYGGLRATALAVALRLNLETAPDLMRQAFAEEKGGRFNSRRYFLDQTHPQIRLPANRAELEALRATHTGSALRLASLRPDTLVGLDESAFASLQRAMAAPSPFCLPEGAWSLIEATVCA